MFGNTEFESIVVCNLYCIFSCKNILKSCNPTQSVDLGFIPLVESYQKALKMLSTASLFGALHLGEVEEKSRVQTTRPKYSDAIRSLVNGG